MSRGNKFIINVVNFQHLTSYSSLKFLLHSPAENYLLLLKQNGALARLNVPYMCNGYSPLCLNHSSTSGVLFVSQGSNKKPLISCNLTKIWHLLQPDQYSNTCALEEGIIQLSLGPFPTWQSGPWTFYLGIRCYLKRILFWNNYLPFSEQHKCW